MPSRKKRTWLEIKMTTIIKKRRYQQLHAQKKASIFKSDLENVPEITGDQFVEILSQTNLEGEDLHGCLVTMLEEIESAEDKDKETSKGKAET